MKIETDDWLTLVDASAELGIPMATIRRLARDLGVMEVIFGVQVVRKRDLETLRKNRRRVGNQRWIADGEEAAADSLKAVASRMARLAREKSKEPRS